MSDSIGDRMKGYYENRTRYSLVRRTYTIIRIDGKAFHTYTNGLDRPFDAGFIEDMNDTAKYLCKNVQGSKFGYVQSDEISLLLTDFDDIQTDMWFDGNIQKMCSVAASIATSEFNKLRLKRLINENSGTKFIDINVLEKLKFAEFDGRIFQIPSSIEVENYFIWRQQDATRNSISAVAQSLYSHRELNNKDSDQKQEMIFQKGINWNDYTSREKRGGFIGKVEKIEYPLGSPHAGISKKGTGPGTTERFMTRMNKPIIRNVWENIECPIFTQDREFLNNRVPKNT